METERVLIDGGECPLLDNETLNIRSEERRVGKECSG